MFYIAFLCCKDSEKMNFWNASADFFVKNQYFPERIL